MTIRDLTYVGEGLIPAPLHGDALRYTPLPKGDVTDIALHHWTGFLPPATWTAAEEIAYIIRIDEYHRTGRGLDGIGYQLCVFPSSRVYITARLDRYGAGVGGENDHTLHIGLPGTFHIQIPSPLHLTGTVQAVRHGYDYLGRDVPTVPHLAWGGTTCPGACWPEWVPQLQAAAEEDHMASKEFNTLNARIDRLKKLHEGNRSYHRRVHHLTGLAAQAGYSTSRASAKARLDQVVAYAKDLKARVDSKQSTP